MDFEIFFSNFFITLLIVVIVIVALIMFFSPLIIISKLSKIISLLDKIGYSNEMHHQETMNTMYGNSEQEEPEQKKSNISDKLTDELMKSLFQDEKNTSDQ